MIHLSLLLISGGLIMWTFHTNARRKRSAAMKSSLTHSNHIDTPEEELKKPAGGGQPDYSEISRLFRIGDMHFTRGSFEEAEQHFIKVLAQDPQHVKALDKLGLIYIQQNQPRKAEMIYRKLFSISQKSLPITVIMDAVYIIKNALRKPWRPMKMLLNWMEANPLVLSARANLL